MPQMRVATPMARLTFSTALHSMGGGMSRAATPRRSSSPAAYRHTKRRRAVGSEQALRMESAWAREGMQGTTQAHEAGTEHGD